MAFRRSRTNVRLITLGALLVTLIAGMAVWLGAERREVDRTESLQLSASLAQVLAEQTSRTLQPVDLILREISARLSTVGAETPGILAAWNSKAMFDLLTEHLKGLPAADMLMVVGADGLLLNFTRSYPPMRLNVSGRDYYQHLSTHDDHELFISAPVQQSTNHAWVIFLGRRINGVHGEFVGLVGSAVTLEHLEDFYKAVTPENGSVTLLRRDGTVLVRYPPLDHQSGSVMPAVSPWYQALREGGGSYRSPGYLDGTAHLVAVRPLRDFTLVIDAATTEATFLAVWYQQVRWLAGGAACAAGGVIFLLCVFGWQFGRLERSKASLARQNAQLESGRLQFDAVLENISQGLTFFDGDQRLMVCNRRYIEICRLTLEQSRVGTSLADILEYRIANGSFVAMSPADYLARRKRLSDGNKPFDVTDELCDGRTISMHYKPLPHGGWVVTHEDVTERRLAEASLAFMARHDALTELPNRTLFQERLFQAIAEARHGAHCALLCIDLDRFKVINDTLGHPAGDELLRAVAGRLLSAVREGDTVARLGGDEFAVVQVGIKSPSHAAILADRIIAAIRQPVDIAGDRILTGASIGISIAPTDGNTSEALQKNADTALYVAKTEGRGTRRFFEPKLDAHVQELRQVEMDLRKARPTEDFELHYQPILDLGSGRVTGFEALLRWNHPVRGMVSPGDFIPIAEETGLIIPIGAWALQAACKAAADWPDNIEIAVNLSPVQFRNTRLIDDVQAALTVSGLAPERLELEITESVLLQSSEDSLALLRQLRALGIRIALDDFGTGYSSLSYLRSFPFDKIKIDQSFVRDMNTNKEATVIVGAIIGLARSLGMATVAEGVETPQQLATLRDQGCIRVQGYLFSRPRPVVDVPCLIQTLRVPGRSDPAPEETAGVIGLCG